MVSPSLTLLRTQADDRLIVLARNGHERAFEAIVERYRRPLLRHGCRLLGEARAEEAVQQAFVAAWMALQRGDEVRHVRGWLHRIVHNAALNAMRGERGDHAELRELLDGAGGPEDELERRELLRDTLANLAALPARQREALLRIAVEGESAEEVGSSLGLTEGAVRQLLYRARTTLRAAATAVTPMPVASWLARVQPLTERIAELAGGAGPAGLGPVLAKTGVVVVVAGSAAAGPAVLDDGSPRAGGAARSADTATRAGESTSDAVGRAALSGFGGSTGSASGGSGASGSGSSGSGSEGDSSGSGSSGSGSSGSGSSGSGSDGDSNGSDSSGSGSSGSGSSDADSSGSGSTGSGSSGSGSGDADNSGPASSGSGTSGSGTSGSGTSGSGSGGSVSSGSDTSGSGSSGSDSSGSGTSGSGASGSGSDPTASTTSGSGGSGSSDTASGGSDESDSGSALD
jgi:RNA polymerase sigma factor (sigma-70 family)